MAWRLPGVILERQLLDERRGFLWWALGIVVLSLMYLAVYPSIGANQQFQDLLASYPPEILAFLGTTDLTTPAGYLTSENFNIMVPILLLIVGVRAAVRSIAGLEREGTLDLVLATPTPRWRVVLESWVGVALFTLALVLVQLVMFGVLGPAFTLTVSVVGLAAMCLSLWLLVLLYSTLALAIGAATGRTEVAAGVATVLAVVSFLVQTLAKLADWIKPLGPYSPWTWYIGNEPLVNGLRPVDLAVFVVLILVFLVLGTLGFQRRDVGT